MSTFNTEKSNYSQIFYRETQTKDLAPQSTETANVNDMRQQLNSPDLLSTSSGLRNRYTASNKPKSHSKPPTFSIFDDARLASVEKVPSSNNMNEFRSPSLHSATTHNVVNTMSTSKSNLWSRVNEIQDQSNTPNTPKYGLPINETPYPQSNIQNSTQPSEIFSPYSSSSSHQLSQTPLETRTSTSRIYNQNESVSGAILTRGDSKQNSQYGLVETNLSQSSIFNQAQNQRHHRYDDNIKSTALINIDTDYLLTWVLVLGLNNAASTSVGMSGNNGGVTSALLKLQEFGHITDHIVCQGNWMFVKFENIEQAERAVSKGIIQLTSYHMLSLMAATLANTASFGIDLSNHINSSHCSETAATIGINSNRTNLDDVGVSYRSINRPNAPNEYLRPPKKTSNICSKIMEYFFSY